MHLFLDKNKSIGEGLVIPSQKRTLIPHGVSNQGSLMPKTKLEGVSFSRGEKKKFKQFGIILKKNATKETENRSHSSNLLVLKVLQSDILDGAQKMHFKNIMYRSFKSGTAVIGSELKFVSRIKNKILEPFDFFKLKDAQGVLSKLFHEDNVPRATFTSGFGIPIVHSMDPMVKDVANTLVTKMEELTHTFSPEGLKEATKALFENISGTPQADNLGKSLGVSIGSGIKDHFMDALTGLWEGLTNDISISDCLLIIMAILIWCVSSEHVSIAGKIVVALGSVYLLHRIDFLPLAQKVFDYCLNNIEKMGESIANMWKPTTGINSAISLSNLLFNAIAPDSWKEYGYTTFIKSIKGFSQTHRDLGSLFQCLVDAAQSIMDWVCKNILQCGNWNFMRTGIVTLEEWVDKVVALQDKHRKSELIESQDLADEVFQLYLDAVKLNGSTMDREMNTIINTKTMHLMRFIVSLQTELAGKGLWVKGARQEPLILMLRGGTGVGKSHVLRPLIFRFLARILPDDLLVRFKKDNESFIYARVVEQEFWDGYLMQFVTFYDEFGITPLKMMEIENEFKELIRIGNPFDYPLHMSDLASKGSVYFRSKVVVCTSNICSIYDSSIDVLVFPEALLRRFHFNIIVVPSPEFCTEETKKLPFYQRALDLGKLSKNIGFEPKVYSFYVCNEHEIAHSEPITYEELLDRMCVKYRKLEDKATLMSEAFQNELRKGEAERDKYQRSTALATGGYDVTQPGLLSKKEAELKFTNFIQMIDRVDSVGNFTVTHDQLKDSWYTLFPVQDSLTLIRPEEDSDDDLDDLLMLLEPEDCNKVMSFLDKFVLLPAFLNYVDRGIKEALINISLIRLRARVNSTIVFMRPYANKMYLAGRLASNKIKDFVVLVKRACQKMYAEAPGMEFLGRCLIRVVASYAAIRIAGAMLKMLWPGRKETPFDFLTADLLMETNDGPIVSGWHCTNGIPNVDDALKCVVTKTLEKNTYFITTESCRMGFCIFVKDFIAIMPYHFIKSMAFQMDSGVASTCSFMSQDHKVFTIKIGDFTDIFGTSGERVLYADPSKDLVIVNLENNVTGRRPNITEFFVSKEFLLIDQGHVYYPDQLVSKPKMKIYPFKVVKGIHMEDDGYACDVAHTVTFAAHAKRGDCGFPVFLVDPTTRCRRIIGFEIAAFFDGSGATAASVIDGDTLKKILSNFGSQKITFVCTSGDTGLMRTIGTIPRPVGTNSFTSIRKSALYGKWGPAKKRPSHLKTYTNGQGEDVNPYLNAKSKFLTPRHKAPDRLVVKQVLQMIKAHIINESTPFKPYFSTFEESVVGIPERPFFDSINRMSSAGYPYCLEQVPGKPGKTRFFGTGTGYEFTSPECHKLKDKYDKNLEELKKGIRPQSYFIFSLKDELLLHEKADRKTRGFSADSLDTLLLCVHFFKSFIAWTMENRIKNCMAPGINPYSREWDFLYNKMNKFGGDIVEGDFGSFDASLLRMILEEIGEMIISFFFEYASKEEILAMRTLWNHISLSWQIFGDVIIEIDGTNPSGNLLTTLINGLYQIVVFVLFWISIHGNDPDSMYFFFDFIVLVVFGDDSMLSADKSYADRVNFTTMKAYFDDIGMKFTSPYKDDRIVAGTRPLSKAMFLKRGFRWDNIVGRYVAPLSLDTIMEIPYWTKKGCLRHIITRNNVENSIRELSLHTNEVFSMYANMIIRNSIEFIGYCPPCTSKRDLVRIVTDSGRIWNANLSAKRLMLHPYGEGVGLHSLYEEVADFEVAQGLSDSE